MKKIKLILSSGDAVALEKNNIIEIQKKILELYDLKEIVSIEIMYKEKSTAKS